MKIIFCHGEKGGVGKSTAAMALIEGIRAQGQVPFLIEGDTGVPDIAARYRGVVDGAQIPLSRPDLADEAVGELLELLESSLDDLAGRPVVVNLPAGAAATVDRSAELIHAVCLAAGWELATLYLVGSGIESAKAATDSLNHGLASVSGTKIALQNLMFGDPIRWHWVNDGHRATWENAGGRVLNFTELTPRVVKIICGAGPLGPLISGEDPGLFLVDRSLLGRWLNSFQPVLEALGLASSEGPGDDQ